MNSILKSVLFLNEKSLKKSNIKLLLKFDSGVTGVPYKQQMVSTKI